MGRRPVEKKKQPGDYPVFAFRVSRKDKAALEAAIKSAQARLNAKRRGEGAGHVFKNDVLVRAILRGLKDL